MEVLPLRWQGASHIESLRRIVVERAGEWVAHWSVPNGRTEPSVETLGAWRPDAVGAAAGWYGLRDEQAALALRVGERTFERIGAAFAGIAVADDCGLASGLGRRAIEAFARVLLPASAAVWGRSDVPPQAQDTGPRHGAVGLQLAIAGIDIELRLNAALCARLLPPVDTAGPKLTSRREAIAAVDATFDAVLDLGRVALSDSLAFAPGDVIRTSVPIGAGLRLVAERGDDVLAGVLTAEEGHRALKVTDLRNFKEKQR